jgi:hypothetical protein
MGTHPKHIQLLMEITNDKYIHFIFVDRQLIVNG